MRTKESIDLTEEIEEINCVAAAWRKAVPISFKDERIELAHGSGGLAGRRLIEGLIAPYFQNDFLSKLSDAAVFPVQAGRMAMTADSFVVKPLRFPGGSIGSLAVHGTVNDLAVSGARPLYILANLIIEAGLSVAILQEELAAMAQAASESGVLIVGGDTKVVEHGKADGLYISTAGVGVVEAPQALSAEAVSIGDKVILSGAIGDHGITVLLARGELDLAADIKSDSRSVWPLVKALLEACPQALRWMRDPTRGGVSASLNELAADCGYSIVLEEESLPVDRAVRGACEVLGLDVLHVANEGQFLAIVDAASAEIALAALKSTPGGSRACIVGEVVETKKSPRLLVRTPYGASRVVDMLVGDQLPRIC